MTDLPSPVPGPPGRVLAVVKDLFFVARIRETARLAGVPLSFTRTPEDLRKGLEEGPVALVLIDLTTGGLDYASLFDVVDAAESRPSVLGYTTHALAAATKPMHGRCDRVVTKETLTAELGEILQATLRTGRKT
jgi:hypothetical protein